MAPSNGTGPAATPVPIDGDGSELVGMVVDGRYRLDATLGRGGMGLVFRATHIGLRRQVAVKILHPSLAASPDVRSRFEREALAVGKVDHPNCVATYDVGRLPDGSLYLAMELLDGRSLADVLEREGQLAPGRALHILAHVLRGLSSVHAAGLIHRDIKPENIVLIRQGDDVDFAKILDFGIAKPMSGELADDGVRLTQAGMAFGTPIYMAPEQALGNKLDGRADLYAAAVIAYEMLAGQPPFYSEDKLEVMSMHAAKAVPPMRTRLIKRGKPVPSSIERLIVKGLTKKPSDRYESADVFLAKVDAALATPDGGVTDVNFERPGDTGSHPLIDDEGGVSLHDDAHVEGEHEDDTSHAIASAIDEVLHATPAKPSPAVAKRPTGARPALASGGPPASSVAGGRRGVIEEPRTKLGVAPPPTTPKTAADSGELIAPSEPRTIPMYGAPPPRVVEPPVRIETRASTAQIAPRAAAKRSWPIYAGVLAAALAAGIAIAVVTTSKHRGGGAPAGGSGAANPAAHGDHGDHSATVAPSEPGDVDPNLKAAQDAVVTDPVRAIEIVEQNKDTLGKNADAQLVLAQARMMRNEYGKALAAYKSALALSPSDADNDTLRASLKKLATDRSTNNTVDVAIGALDLWFGSTSDKKAAGDAIAKAAVSPLASMRVRARALVDKYQLGDAVDWVISYAYDLNQEASCAARKEAVEKLRATNSAKAIPWLESAVTRRNQKRNACLLADAKQGIADLQAAGSGASGSGG